jgi:hypothetical protein
MAETPNTVFLLGAGFTKSVFPEAPLNKDLLPIICKGSPCTTLKGYHSEYKTNDIEILLTYLDLEILHTTESRRISLQTVRKTIDGDIAQYFKQFRFKAGHLKEKNWLETLATRLFKENDAIITTNYDCFLEGLLDYHKTWHPKNGYVNALDPRIKTNSPETPENPKGIKFYKIHGSEHFRECKVSDEKGETGQTIIGFIVNEDIYPVSGKDSNLGWVEKSCKEYIVAPSFVKIPHVQIADMVNKAVSAAQNAKNMVICGSRLRDEDSFLQLILTGFMNGGFQNKKKLIIIGPEACVTLEKIKNFLVGNIKHINFISIPKGIKEGLVDLIKLLEDCKTNG